MAIDRLGVFLSAVGICTSLVAMTVAYHHYRRYKTTHFQFGMFGFLSFSIWISGYLFSSLNSSVQDFDQVRIVLNIGAIWAFLGIASIVLALEYAKIKPNYHIIYFTLFGGGLLAALHMHPNMHTLIWTQQGWITSYQTPLIFGLILYFVICTSDALPAAIRAWYRVWHTERYAYGRRILLLAAVGSYVLVFLRVIFSRMNLSLFRTTGLFVTHQLDFLIYLSVFMGLIAFVTYQHPTIFYAANPDPVGLYIVDRMNSTPIYHFDFSTGDQKFMFELFSMVCISIRHVLLEALHSESKLESIRTGGKEVLISEGDTIIGFLVTQKGSPLLSRLLTITVQQFEENYSSILLNNLQPPNSVQPNIFHPFDGIVQKQFEFALPQAHNSISLT